MQPYQERVVVEKKELDDKLDKLVAFIEQNPVFQTLPDAEQQRLVYQRNIMKEYSAVLTARIEAF